MSQQADASQSSILGGPAFHPTYETESAFEDERMQGFWARTKSKTAVSPFFPLGMAGFTGIAGYGIYNYFKNKNIRYADGASKTLYWTKLRVMAQGFAVAVIGLGFLQSLITDNTQHERPGGNISSDGASSAVNSRRPTALAAPTMPTTTDALAVSSAN